jgi:hypothetical protein
VFISNAARQMRGLKAGSLFELCPEELGCRRRRLPMLLDAPMLRKAWFSSQVAELNHRGRLRGRGNGARRLLADDVVIVK